jgi:hypothetical protein
MRLLRLAAPATFTLALLAVPLSVEARAPQRVFGIGILSMAARLPTSPRGRDRRHLDPTELAAKAATTTVPIVFQSGSDLAMIVLERLGGGRSWAARM